MKLALLAQARILGRRLAKRLVGRALVLATVMTSSAAAAQPPAGASEPRRHHVGVQLGVFNPSTKIIELGNLGFRLERSDGQTILRYRYSMNPRIDLVAELKYWTRRGPIATSGKDKVSGGFHRSGNTRPPVDAEESCPPTYKGTFITLRRCWESLMSSTNTAWGLVWSGGVDLEVTDLISIPIEATYVGNGGGGGLDDLSGFGLSVGINFNF